MVMTINRVRVAVGHFLAGGGDLIQDLHFDDAGLTGRRVVLRGDGNMIPGL